MPTYIATTLDLFWQESSRKVLDATIEPEAIDEAILYADFIGQILHSMDCDDGTRISFELPSDIPVHDVEVLIEDEGKAIETEVPSCTIDGVQTLVELLWAPKALLAVRFGGKVMNFDNRRIIALNAPKNWHFPIHYLLGTPPE